MVLLHFLRGSDGPVLGTVDRNKALWSPKVHFVANTQTVVLPSSLGRLADSFFFVHIVNFFI